MAPAPGSPAPSFSLPDQDGSMHPLAGYKGKWVVLYFYPKDGTPGCTAEACGFRDAFNAYRGQGVEVLGVSRDSVLSHKKFAAKHKLPFPLLADEEGDVIKAYGAVKDDGGTQRKTFLIDPQGFIAKIYERVDPQGHSEEILRELMALSRP